MTDTGGRGTRFPEQSGRGNRADHEEATALMEMDRYGIEVVSVKFFLWGGFRYSNARDALAAARRKERC